MIQLKLVRKFPNAVYKIYLTSEMQDLDRSKLKYINSFRGEIVNLRAKDHQPEIRNHSFYIGRR